jgi:energy-coupling factor transport system permease protein
MKLTAFTRLILVLAVTAWVFLLPIPAVATILALELVILLYIKRDRMTMAAIGTLTVFTAMMVVLQLLFGSKLYVALTGGLRMFVMTTAFLCLLASTKIQDIAQALVEKFHMPYEYAFMLTTALRFVPDFLSDSAVTLDAQSCRGYSNRGNALKRLFAYLAVVKPLVMRAVAKSDTLALSMELKGFGPNTYKNRRPMKLGLFDYVVLLITIVLCAYPFWAKKIGL